MLRALLAGLACCLLMACATAPRPAAQAAPPLGVSPAEMTRADALVNEGCYRCLREALTLYERAVLTDQQFSTTLLLALREKELGMDALPWLERARAMATAATVHYIDIATAIPWTAPVSASDFDTPFPRPSQVAFEQWLRQLRPPSPSALDRYMLLALQCGRQQTPAGVVADTPLLQYRLGICNFGQRQQLDTVFATSPRFAEAGYFIARNEMVNSGAAPAQVTRALPLLTTAHEAIPESPAITVSLARVWAGRNEFLRALALHDEALALRPAQRDALLGRATMLTYLGRADQAIVSATRLIDLGTWYLGDAYYWRAWNLYNTGQVDAAALDVERARQFQSGDQLLTLSGMIAYDQQRRAKARKDFENSRRMNPVNCPALWYLGTINVDERTWSDGRDMFAEAARCYGLAVDVIANEQTAPDLSPEMRQWQEQDRARRLADNRRQQARSALNVALLSQQLGDRDQAREFAEIAAGHELTRDRAQGVLTSVSGFSTPPRDGRPAAPSPATSAVPASPR